MQDNYTAEITYTNCNGSIVTETATNTVFVNSAAGQIPSLGLTDTIKSLKRTIKKTNLMLFRLKNC